MFRGKYCVVQGLDHKKVDKVCQDSAGVCEKENFAIAVISDGHGGKKYIRSDVGSKYAVETAIETVCMYMEDYEAFTEAIKKDSDYILSRMERYFITKWIEKIEDYNDEHELTEPEKETIEEAKKKDNKEVDWHSYYGCTILIAVMAKGYSYGMLVGDGTFGVVYEDGSCRIPIEDPYAVGNMTSSICMKQSINLFQHYFEEKQPISMAVSSDGVCKSFGSEETLKHYHIKLTYMMNSEQFDAKLKANLESFANKGSQDDCSLAVVYSPEGLEAHRKEMQQALAKIKKQEEEWKQQALAHKKEMAERMEQIRLENERKKQEEIRRAQEAERIRKEEEMRQAEAERRREAARKAAEERRKAAEARRKAAEERKWVVDSLSKKMDQVLGRGQRTDTDTAADYEKMRVQLEHAEKARELAEREAALKQKEYELLKKQMAFEKSQLDMKKEAVPEGGELQFKEGWGTMDKVTEIKDKVETELHDIEEKLMEQMNDLFVEEPDSPQPEQMPVVADDMVADTEKMSTDTVEMPADIRKMEED